MQEIEQIGGFLQRVRAVRDHRAEHVVVFERLRDDAAKLEHEPGRHVGARHVGEFPYLDGADVAQSGNGIHQLLAADGGDDPEFGIELHGDGAAGGQNEHFFVHDGILVWRGTPWRHPVFSTLYAMRSRAVLRPRPEVYRLKNEAASIPPAVSRRGFRRKARFSAE